MIPAALSSLLQQGARRLPEGGLPSPTRGAEEVIPRFVHSGHPTPAWNDGRDIRSGTVAQAITDDGPRERTVVYEAPFDACDWKADYDVAWTHFAKRTGSTECKP